jgi:hypothetical protein
MSPRVRGYIFIKKTGDFAFTALGSIESMVYLGPFQGALSLSLSLSLSPSLPPSGI